MMFTRKDLRVYFIMGSNNCDHYSPLTILEGALKGGVTMFQFREKGMGAKTGVDKKQLAQDMQRLCRKYQVPFIVNDDLDLALEIKADGVHVGQEDAGIDKVKLLCPNDFLVGVSATNEKEAVQAMKDGADYIGVGPIFTTTSKSDAKEPIDIEGIIRIRSLVGNTPIVAIGGIKQKHVGSIISAGADGVSVIGAITQASSPEKATKELLSNFR
ncbi:thiamine phosphate synthase [Paraliobacillus zengyii]|uniref:thiamine phosphate synthase n=1 Tax=Paraliobacillus zengyii TaxID=2213194 RepID=UPI001E5D38C2